MENAENLQMLAGMVWGVVAFVAGFYFVGCYLLEILAQKLGEPRWMAWLPIANGVLVFRLAGWGSWFWALLGGWVLAGVTAALSPGLALFLMIPLGLATVIISLVIWLKIARRRGLSQAVGLLIVLPNFAPLLELVLPTMGLLTIGSWFAALGAFAYLVFYDGGPEHSPHPIGYLMTTCLAALIGVPMMMLPAQMAENPQLAAKMEQFQAALAAAQNGEDSGDSDLWGELGAVMEREPPSASATGWLTAEPAHVPPADECPAGAREAGSRPPGGDHWWCEALVAGEWVRHGPSRTWFAHGKVESEGSYDNGQEQGTWSRYWKTGGPKVRAEFHRGQQHGWMRSWDELGRLDSEVYFEHGKPVGSPAGM